MKPPYKTGGPPRADQGPRSRGEFTQRSGPSRDSGGGERPPRRYNTDGPARPDAGDYIDRPARSGDGERPARSGGYAGRPPEGQRAPRPSGEGGFKPRGEGFRPRGEGGFKPRGEGFQPRGEGGFKPRSEGGFKPRGEGFQPRGEGGFKPRGEGGFKPRGEGFQPRGEGGFKPRGEGFQPRGEGGFKPRGEGFQPRGEGGFKPRGEGFQPRGEGGFKPRGEGFQPRGEGGFKPRGEGFQPRGEGGFKPRGEGFRPRPEGGFKPRGEGFQPRGEGGFKPRGEGFRDAGDRPPRRPDTDRSEGGGYRPHRDAGAERTTLHARRGSDDLRPREERSGSWTGDRKFETPFRAFDTTSDDPRTTHSRARQAESDERAAANAAREVDLAEQRRNEFRVYGLNAVLALFRSRPESIRKLWFANSRRDVLADLITHCASSQVGYNEVEAIELERIAGSEHHEGVIVAALRPDLPSAAAVLAQLAASTGPQLVLLLDGVANPHNVGAILRSAAHFGAAAVLLAPGSSGLHNGSVYRIAEGGAEAQPVVPLTDLASLSVLVDGGFVLAATAADAEQSLLSPGVLPSRVLLALGAESHGISEALREQAQLRLSIPGTGAVESLNVAAAAAVALAVWRASHAG